MCFFKWYFMRKWVEKGLFLFFFSSYAQKENIKFRAIVENESTGLPMQSVHVLNLTQVIGTTTDPKGVFEINAKTNDTLYFSFLGYKALKIVPEHRAKISFGRNHDDS